MLFGGDPDTVIKPFPVTTQPGALDSIPPSYPCPHADDVRNTYQSVAAWTDHIQANADLQRRLDETLGTANLSAWSSWCTLHPIETPSLLSLSLDDHFFDTFTSRTCNGHPLPCNSTGSCVSEVDASKVHEIGDWEYKSSHSLVSASQISITCQLKPATFGTRQKILPSTISSLLAYSC
jgi:2-phosphoxylose phosphatase